MIYKICRLNKTIYPLDATKKKPSTILSVFRSNLKNLSKFQPQTISGLQ